MYNDQEKAIKYLIVGAGMIAIIFGRPVRNTNCHKTDTWGW